MPPKSRQELTCRRAFLSRLTQAASVGGQKVPASFGITADGEHSFQPPHGKPARYALNVNRLPVVQRISFSGISRLTISTKLEPLQCIGIR